MVFSVDTPQQAMEIQVRFGRLGYDGWYRWTGAEKWNSYDSSVLTDVTKELKKWWTQFHGGS